MSAAAPVGEWFPSNVVSEKKWGISMLLKINNT